MVTGLYDLRAQGFGGVALNPYLLRRGAVYMYRIFLVP